MPNVAKMQEVFNKVLQKYENAEHIRLLERREQFQIEEQARLKSEVKLFKEQFEAAVNEA